MSAIEILWMAHEDNIAYIVKEKKSQARKYFNETKDWAMMRWWDSERLADKSEDGGRGDM